MLHPVLTRLQFYNQKKNEEGENFFVFDIVLLSSTPSPG